MYSKKVIEIELEFLIDGFNNKEYILKGDITTIVGAIKRDPFRKSTNHKGSKGSRIYFFLLPNIVKKIVRELLLYFR